MNSAARRRLRSFGLVPSCYPLPPDRRTFGGPERWESNELQLSFSKAREVVFDCYLHHLVLKRFQ
jgi:hypothetical protein